MQLIKQLLVTSSHWYYVNKGYVHHIEIERSLRFNLFTFYCIMQMVIKKWLSNKVNSDYKNILEPRYLNKFISCIGQNFRPSLRGRILIFFSFYFFKNNWESPIFSPKLRAILEVTHVFLYCMFCTKHIKISGFKTST